MPDFEIENGFLKDDCKIICGVDEAGRGPLAGPVCAAAVILPENIQIDGLNDSKKLSEKKREALFDVVKNVAVSYGIAYATVEEIEELNILNATFLAMKRAIKQLSVLPQLALIDGNRIPSELPCKAECVIKGDAKSMSIAAASILAKVSRDRLMKEYDEEYPEYMFAKHKGYGTALHYEKIKENGICEIHRKSFLKGII